MIVDIRMRSQQLASPSIKSPRELVSWMGAVQAQDYPMSKWAVGTRLQSGALQTVDLALRRGEILRTHVLRPTWHMVAAEDIRWMLALSVRRIKSAYASSAKGHLEEITEKQYAQGNDLLVEILGGGRSLTSQEIEAELHRRGVETHGYRTKRLIANAEVDGVVCSGVDKGSKSTFALLDERVPPTPELHREEALARLAGKYFRSHSPAGLNDFVWWSGLSIAEARQAIGLIESELIADRFDAEKLFVHESYKETAPSQDDILQLLPSFDEYLISYKDRTAALDLKHYPKAFNNCGTFYPVILHNGRVVGNWRKSLKRGQIVIETSFFDPGYRIAPELIEQAADRYKGFFGSPTKE